jgi:hypothetical protein
MASTVLLEIPSNVYEAVKLAAISSDSGEAAQRGVRLRDKRKKTVKTPTFRGNRTK